MIKIVCNICLKTLPDLPADRPVTHFCERCQPFAEQFSGEMRQLCTEHQGELLRKMNRLREQFLHQKVVPTDKQHSLKVV